MESLMVNNVELFPRFHEQVKIDFSKHQAKMENIELELSENTSDIQRILLDLMSKSVKEVKQSGIDLGSFSVESLLTWYGMKRWIDERVQPVWDLLNAQAKNAIADLKELKKLASVLIYSSPVFFYHLCMKLKAERIEKQDIGWIEWPSAMEVFRLAKARVFDPKGQRRIESVAKWDAFQMLLHEIEQKSKDTTGNKLLIVTKDYNSYLPVKYLLHEKSSAILDAEFDELILGKDSSQCDSDRPLFNKNLEIFLHKSGSTAFGIDPILSDMQPQFILLYEMDLECIRQIESYKARRPKVPCHVFTLCYKKSIDEQQFLTSSKKEISSFEFMIENKDTMVKDVGRESVNDSDYRKGFNVMIKVSTLNFLNDKL